MKNDNKVIFDGMKPRDTTRRREDLAKMEVRQAHTY